MLILLPPYPLGRSIESTTTVVDLTNNPSSELLRRHRINAALHDEIHLDVDGGIAQGSSANPYVTQGELETKLGGAFGLQVHGPARTYTPGRDVIANCSASDAGWLVLGESDDGKSWRDGALIEVLGVTLGVRFACALSFYRVGFLARRQAVVSKVHITSQLRATEQ